MTSARRTPIRQRATASSRTVTAAIRGCGPRRDEVGVAAPPRHHVLMQVPGDPGARHCALVQADVEAVWASHGAQHSHCGASDVRDLAHFVRGQVGVVGDVAIWHRHQMARVVGIEVQDRIAELSAGDDEAVLVGQRRGPAERAFRAGIGIRRLALAKDVGHPMWRPQSPEGVRLAGVIRSRTQLGFGHEKSAAVGDVFTRRAMNSTTSSTAASTSTPLRCSPSR